MIVQGKQYQWVENYPDLVLRGLREPLESSRVIAWSINLKKGFFSSGRHKLESLAALFLHGGSLSIYFPQPLVVLQSKWMSCVTPTRNGKFVHYFIPTVCSFVEVADGWSSSITHDFITMMLMLGATHPNRTIDTLVWVLGGPPNASFK